MSGDNSELLPLLCPRQRTGSHRLGRRARLEQQHAAEDDGYQIVLSLTAKGLITGEIAAHFAADGATVSKDSIFPEERPQRDRRRADRLLHLDHRSRCLQTGPGSHPTYPTPPYV